MLKIIFDFQNERRHKDLSLIFDELELVEMADSYYLSIDQEFMINSASGDKIILILGKMIKWWIKQVLELCVNEIAFLPFDLSDQYIGCFRVLQINNTDVSICYGFTTRITGYNITPSNMANLILLDEDFKIASKVINLNKLIFVSYIEQSVYYN